MGYRSVKTFSSVLLRDWPCDTCDHLCHTAEPAGEQRDHAERWCPELLSRHRELSVNLLALLGSCMRGVLSTATCVGVSPGLLSLHHRQYTDCTGYILRTEAYSYKTHSGIRPLSFKLGFVANR